MQSILHSVKMLTDPSRIRMLSLMEEEELSVAELQEILSMNQSTLSTHLAQLKKAGLVEDRKLGKNAMYRMKEASDGPLYQLYRQIAEEMEEGERDRAALRLIQRKRRDKVRAYFDELAGKFGKHYVPGRSWKALAEVLLKLMPPVVVADLGAGEGTFSQLLAQRAERVIAVDNSARMVEFGSGLAREHGLENIEYREGDMEALPIEDASVDIAFFSQSLHHAQHPAKAVKEANRILRAGGKIAILDLVKHHREEAREMFADVWMGFSQAELSGFLVGAGFVGIETAVVDREEQAPHFETLLAVGLKRAD